MSKRIFAVALAACVMAGGILLSYPASAAGKSDTPTLKSQAKEEQNQIKTNVKALENQGKADLQQVKKNGKSFLERLWPFGKHEEEPVPYPQQKRFGTGNPRDTSQVNGPTRPVTTKTRSHRRVKREGSNFTRPIKSKKHHASEKKSTASSRRDERAKRNLSHKNGEYRKATHKQHHAPSGLNWNLQRNRTPAKDKLNKDGKYRPTQ